MNRNLIIAVIAIVLAATMVLAEDTRPRENTDETIAYLLAFVAKSGILQSATFDVNVTTGRASGTCAGDVQGSDHRSLNRRTGSERGAFNRITSFITNAMKIRGTNMPDKSGSMKIGEVKYTRKRDDTFLQLVWFPLRSGVGDVVGF
jgi:hypothetical protein